MESLCEGAFGFAHEGLACACDAAGSGGAVDVVDGADLVDGEVGEVVLAQEVSFGAFEGCEGLREGLLELGAVFAFEEFEFEVALVGVGSVEELLVSVGVFAFVLCAGADAIEEGASGGDAQPAMEGALSAVGADLGGSCGRLHEEFFAQCLEEVFFGVLGRGVATGGLDEEAGVLSLEGLQGIGCFLGTCAGEEEVGCLELGEEVGESVFGGGLVALLGEVGGECLGGEGELGPCVLGFLEGIGEQLGEFFTGVCLLLQWGGEGLEEGCGHGVCLAWRGLRMHLWGWRDRLFCDIV